MSGVVIQKNNGYAGGSYPTEGSLLYARKNQPSGVGPGIIGLHGRGGDCTQYSPTSSKLGPGYFAELLALDGYRVMAIDDMGGTDWGAQPSTDRINDAITWLQSTGGAKSGKVGIMGWSMGGCAALNWIDQNPAKHACSWLWAPCSDLSWAHAQATWTAEIETAYGGSSAYAADLVDNPVSTPANYRGVGPIKMAHARDDAIIPQSQTQTFVTAVNNAQVTMKDIVSGGHTGLFAAVTDQELLAFFKDSLPVP